MDNVLNQKVTPLALPLHNPKSVNAIKTLSIIHYNIIHL